MIGIVPAAGLATRLGLASGSKEVVQIGGVPVIEHLVRRMEAGGCAEIRIVTRAEKTDVREYAERRGLTIVLGSPPHVGASIASALTPSDSEDLFAIGFPDTLWEPLDGFARLRAALSPPTDIVLGLFETRDAARSDVVVLSRDGDVADIVIKQPNPPSNLVWGCLVARRLALEGVGSTPQPSEHIRRVARRGRVGTVFLSSTWLDVGTRAALASARRRADQTKRS